MILPDVPITFGSRGPLVLRNPRQVHLLDKITDRDDSIGGDCAAANGSHVPLGFGLNVCGWSFPACRDLPQLVGDSLSFDRTSNIPAFPIANVPAITDADDLSVLLSH
jgi:hypothetical protein